jgi:hypothetical protein
VASLPPPRGPEPRQTPPAPPRGIGLPQLLRIGFGLRDQRRLRLGAQLIGLGLCPIRRALHDQHAVRQLVGSLARGSEMLLDRRRLVAAGQHLDVGRDVVGADSAELMDARVSSQRKKLRTATA